MMYVGTLWLVHSRWFEGQGLHVHLEQQLGLAIMMLTTVVGSQAAIVHGLQAMVDRKSIPLIFNIKSSAVQSSQMIRLHGTCDCVRLQSKCARVINAVGQ